MAAAEIAVDCGYPLALKSNMPEELEREITDMAVTACEKFVNNQQAAKYLKEALDLRYKDQYNVVIGEAYAFTVGSTHGYQLLLLTSERTACLIWKAPMFWDKPLK